MGRDPAYPTYNLAVTPQKVSPLEWLPPNPASSPGPTYHWVGWLRVGDLGWEEMYQSWQDYKRRGFILVDEGGFEHRVSGREESALLSGLREVHSRRLAKRADELGVTTGGPYVTSRDLGVAYLLQKAEGRPVGTCQRVSRLLRLAAQEVSTDTDDLRSALSALLELGYPQTSSRPSSTSTSSHVSARACLPSTPCGRGRVAETSPWSSTPARSCRPPTPSRKSTASTTSSEGLLRHPLLPLTRRLHAYRHRPRLPPRHHLRPPLHQPESLRGARSRMPQRRRRHRLPRDHHPRSEHQPREQDPAGARRRALGELMPTFTGTCRCGRKFVSLEGAECDACRDKKNEKPDFDSWTVEKLSEFIYGSSFGAAGIGDQEAFRKHLVSSAERAWEFDQNGQGS